MNPFRVEPVEDDTFNGWLPTGDDDVKDEDTGRVTLEWEDELPGGLADDRMPDDFDHEQLKAGIKVELEHTDDRRVAMEIAMDHLTEDPDYYKKLATIEKHEGRLYENVITRLLIEIDAGHLDEIEAVDDEEDVVGLSTDTHNSGRHGGGRVRMGGPSNTGTQY